MPWGAYVTRETYWVRVNRLLLDYSQAVRNSAFCIGPENSSRHTCHVDNMDHPQQRMPETANEIAAAVFSECLMTLVRTAAMLLGKVTAPATGEPVQDLTRVQLVIQQLELLEKNAAKLSLDEQQLLKQSLQELRMAYVSAAGQRPEDALKEEENPTAESTGTPEADPTPTVVPAETATSEQPEEDEDDDEGSRKRFVKKYN